VSQRIRVAHVTTIDLTLRFLVLGQLVRLAQEGFDVTAISAAGPWTGGLEAMGIRHIEWPHATRSWHPVADARAQEELIAIFRRERFDLVHTHTPKPGVMGRIAARIAGVPCVVNTVHGYYASPQDPWRRQFPVLEMERLAARFSDLELFQSEEDQRWARRERIVGPLQGAYLGNGTDLSRFDPQAVDRERVKAIRRELGIPQSAIVVGTMGRLVAEKGYPQFFEAARVVRDAVPRARFVVIGGGDPEKADRITPEEVERAREDVVFTGWRDDVPELLALMDVFVLASWREGMPRSAIEAAAMGKPLVLTDIRGCREVARDGVEGLLVPPRLAVPLANAIHRLASDAKLRRRLGAAARTRASERFDERQVCDKVVGHYRRLLTAKGLTSIPGNDNGTKLRHARDTDATALARLHRRTLPGAFLSSLGERFLRELYRALIEDPKAVALVVERDGRVVGLATGARSVRRLYRRFYGRHALKAAIAAGPKLVRPEVLRRVRETAAYPVVSNGLTGAELLSICVDPSARERGIGRRLADEVIRSLGELGAREVKVVVDAANEAGNRFYRAVGFRLERTLAIHDGTTSNVWVIECRSSLGSRSQSS
jgi:glycosyltransferase involved in cell wall biosynthesis/ribosomal protein S18 acetylase RimI-like enzyme